MPDFDRLIERSRGDGNEVWIAGPASDKAIARLEQLIGVRLPPSYRRFLRTYGALSVQDSGVSGIVTDDPNEGGGSMYYDTMRFRNEFRLPPTLLVVQPDEDAPYCLDTSTIAVDGEMPIVCFELHSGSAKRIAKSFEQWLATWVLNSEDVD